jgi:hypothetical protein
MTYFQDLSPYTYWLPASDGLPGIPEINVGWLDAGHGFPQGDTAPELVEKLERLCRTSRRYQTRGSHPCPFCQDPEAESSAEIRVAGKGVVYAAPTLIAHYVAVHQYAPPPEFIDALGACEVPPRQPESE